MNSESTSDRVLLHLKSHGPRTARDIADAFSISVMGAHKALGSLCEAGLVRHEDIAEGRGRPHRMFSLTETGHNRFPNRHAELNAELIELIRESFGQDGLDRLVALREARQKDRYAVPASDTLAQKVEKLAQLRAAEGYMARHEVLENGTQILVEDHCPICAAASACKGFCESELTIFRAVLGPDTEVTRDEHLLSGGRRCAYKIAPSKPE